MTNINRRFNVESRSFSASSDMYSGQQFDSLSTTLHFSYEPKDFLEDKADGTVIRPFIIFDVMNEDGCPLMYGNFEEMPGEDGANPGEKSVIVSDRINSPVFDGYSFRIPYSLTSKLKKSTLGYQLFFIRSSANGPALKIPITGDDLGDVEYILSKIDYISLKESIADETLIKEIPEALKPISPWMDPTISAWIEKFRNNCIIAPLTINPESGSLVLRYNTMGGICPGLTIPTGREQNQLPLIVEHVDDGSLLMYDPIKQGFVGTTQADVDVVQDADGITVSGNVLQDASDLQDGLMTKELVTELRGKADAAAYVSKDELSDELTAVRGEIPVDVGSLNNDAGYITNAVADLQNYYSKSETYTQAEVDAFVNSIPRFAIDIVAKLPDKGDEATIYFVPVEGKGTNIHDEFIWIRDKWEQIGSTAFELDIDQTTGIKINGTALENASSTRDGLMTKELVGILNSKQDSGDYATKTEMGLKADKTELDAVEGKIPSEVSQLNNDSGYVTREEIVQMDLPKYYTKEQVDSKLDLKTDVLSAIPQWDPTIRYRQGSTVVKDDVLYISQTGVDNINKDPAGSEQIFWAPISGGTGPGPIPKPPAPNPVKTFIIGDGSSKDIVIHHNLGSFDLFFSVRTRDLRYVQAAIQAIDVNTIHISFTEAPGPDAVTVCIMTGKVGGIEQNVETFEQMNPSASWSVTSSFRNPVFVQAFNKQGEEIRGDIIQTLDSAGNRQVTVKFVEEQTGTLVLKEVIDQDVYTFTNESEWVIRHNKGRVVGVQLYNNEYGQIRADIVQDDPSMNSVRVVFSQPMSGTAIVI